MATIADNITRIKKGKYDLINAVKAKGGSVSPTSSLSNIATAINNLQGSSSISGGTASAISNNTQLFDALLKYEADRLSVSTANIVPYEINITPILEGVLNEYPGIYMNDALNGLIKFIRIHKDADGYNSYPLNYGSICAGIEMSIRVGTQSISIKNTAFDIYKSLGVVDVNTPYMFWPGSMTVQADTPDTISALLIEAMSEYSRRNGRSITYAKLYLWVVENSMEPLDDDIDVTFENEPDDFFKLICTDSSVISYVENSIAHNNYFYGVQYDDANFDTSGIILPAQAAGDYIAWMQTGFTTKLANLSKV